MAQLIVDTIWLFASVWVTAGDLDKPVLFLATAGAFIALGAFAYWLSHSS